MGAAQSSATGATVELVAYDLTKKTRAVGLKKSILPGSPSFKAETSALALQLVDALVKPATAVAKVDDGPSIPLTQQVWFWPAVGAAAAVVVGGVVTGIALAASGPDHPRPGLTITGIP
ncbi:MAG: hypothetical protein HY901_38450 [Deltaproteobacteria bacterium]|nr:hypothetical protein [Deltaproteobacteria bacterium]